MRNRLNVVWCGKRTTVRFPGYLWEMASLAKDCSDDELAAYVRDCLSLCIPSCWDSASEAVRSILVSCVTLKLTPSR